MGAQGRCFFLSGVNVLPVTEQGPADWQGVGNVEVRL